MWSESVRNAPWAYEDARWAYNYPRDDYEETEFFLQETFVDLQNAQEVNAVHQAWVNSQNWYDWARQMEEEACEADEYAQHTNERAQKAYRTSAQAYNDIARMNFWSKNLHLVHEELLK